MARLPRRRFLALGAAGLASAIALRLGVLDSSDDHPHRLDVLVLDEHDPVATPVAYLAQPSATAATNGSTALHPQPAWTSDLLRQVARSGPADRPLIGLTIDDGWSATDDVLKVLSDRKVQPTLFLTGRAVKNDPQFIRRAIDAGCEIGNHTMDHAWLVDKSKAYIQKDLQDFEALVRSVVPDATTLPYMRPSGGALNQTVIDAAAELGYRPILWSASTGDGSSSTTPDQMIQNGLAAAQPGAILLTHFSQRTVAALPTIIDRLRAKGLEPVSLTRLFASSA